MLADASPSVRLGQPSGHTYAGRRRRRSILVGLASWYGRAGSESSSWATRHSWRRGVTGAGATGAAAGRGCRGGEEMCVGKGRRVGVVPRTVRGGHQRGQARRRQETAMHVCRGRASRRGERRIGEGRHVGEEPLVGEGRIGVGRDEERRRRQ
jgi:hypothetical protein